MKKFWVIIQFLDNGYDLSLLDADSDKSLWQHILDDFLILSFNISMREDKNYQSVVNAHLAFSSDYIRAGPQNIFTD